MIPSHVEINKENIKRLKISSDLGEALQLFRANENQSNVGRNNDDNMLISLLFFHFYFLPFFTFFFVSRVISIFSICSLKKEHFFIRQKAAAVEENEAEAIAAISLCTQLCALICIWNSNSTCDDAAIADENFYFLTFLFIFQLFSSNFHLFLPFHFRSLTRRIKSHREWEWHADN